MPSRRPVILSFLFAVLFVGFLGSIAVVDAGQERKKLLPRRSATPNVAPAQAGKILDGSLRKHVLLSVVKHRVIAKLQREGVKGRKYTREEAEAAYAKLTPEMIDGAIAEASPETAKQLTGGRLGDFLDWIVAHQDQILAIIQFVMKLIMLFGDAQAIILTDHGIAIVWPDFTIVLPFG